MKIGFAIITEDRFVNRIVALEHEFHDKAHFFNTLGLVRNLPHITLFQGEMKEDINYFEIADYIADKSAKLFISRNLRFKDIKYVPHGWYFLMCKKSKELFTLHNLVLNKVKSFVVLPDDRMERITEEMPIVQREAIREYNYRYAGEAFCPHITIGRSDSKNEMILDEMNFAITQIDKVALVDRITVYKMGANGTHEETLYETIIP
jgi:2'-5' RNA ligase